MLFRSLGGALAPAGRYYERGKEQAAEAKKKADEAAQVQQQKDAEAKLAAAQEEERKATPEYRKGLANEIDELKQQHSVLNALAKDKTQPKEAQQEARKRLQQITAVLAPKVKELDAINQRIGAVPTVEQSLQEQGYVVDDYGRLVKPDGKEATDEEYGRYFKELDKKRETETLLAKLKSENKAQITEENQHRYVGPLVTSMKANMVQRMLDNYGLLAAGIKEDATVRDLKDQISTLSDPQNLAQMRARPRVGHRKRPPSEPECPAPKWAA